MTDLEIKKAYNSLIKKYKIKDKEIAIMFKYKNYHSWANSTNKIEMMDSIINLINTIETRIILSIQDTEIKKYASYEAVSKATSLLLSY